MQSFVRKKGNVLFVGLCEPEHLTHLSCDFIPFIYKMVTNYIPYSIAERIKWIHCEKVPIQMLSKRKAPTYKLLMIVCCVKPCHVPSDQVSCAPAVIRPWDPSKVEYPIHMVQRVAPVRTPLPRNIEFMVWMQWSNLGFWFCGAAGTASQPPDARRGVQLKKSSWGKSKRNKPPGFQGTPSSLQDTKWYFRQWVLSPAGIWDRKSIPGG